MVPTTMHPFREDIRNPEPLIRAIRAKTEGEAHTRRGICLFNAGRLDEAAAAFMEARELSGSEATLAAYLAACYMGTERNEMALPLLKEAQAGDPFNHVARIRYALGLHANGNREAGIETLREGLRLDAECAELHFQLGVLLCDRECFEEAELRFTQTLNLDRFHVEAMVQLGLCRGMRGTPAEAMVHLQKAQTLRPHDAHIGLLLTQATRAVRQQGLSLRVRAQMFDSKPVEDRRGIEELSRIIETDPDFVDAFLSIPVDEVDEEVFAMLLSTLEAALERQPEHAELHYHCGRVLHRLGRQQDAIGETERAVEVNPQFTRALIELAKLYQQTDRHADATSRLEQAIEAGAEYADVYYLLGNLYRDQGEMERARLAYDRALNINAHYADARQALSELSA